MKRPERPGWERLSSAKAGKCSQRWIHVASGWVVFHCGHPTANWPYAVRHSTEDRGLLVANHGRGWRLVADAFEAVEGLHAGRYALDHGQGNNPGIRRIQTLGDSNWQVTP